MDFLNLRRLCFISLGLLVLTCPTLAQSREYKLKAAFIYNFIKFVEWPGGGSQINVGILGNDPFEGELKKLEQKKVDGKALKVTLLKSAAEAKNYQVVFAGDPQQASALIKAVQGHPVLTISDTPEFSKKGGAIGLISARNRIRFNINQGTLKKANLKASSKLLSLANAVYGAQLQEVGQDTLYAALNWAP